jgi:hypothetical protein
MIGVNKNNPGGVAFPGPDNFGLDIRDPDSYFDKKKIFKSKLAKEIKK